MNRKEGEAVRELLRERPEFLKAFGISEAFELMYFPQYAKSVPKDDALYFLVGMADEVCMVRTEGRRTAR